MEIWKDIKDFEGLYQVSNEGRVRSLDHYASNGRVMVLYKGQIMTPVFNRYTGYLNVKLSKNNKATTRNVHRLVAETFLDNPNTLPQVNHKDEDKTNNRVENLEFCTCSYNANYGTRNERTAMRKRGVTVNGKPVEIVDKSGNVVKEYKSATECADSMGVCVSLVCKYAKHNEFVIKRQIGFRYKRG